MEIVYLDGRVLLRPKFFPENSQEAHRYHRDAEHRWEIYTWNSEGRLSSESFKTNNKDPSIRPFLESYSHKPYVEGHAWNEFLLAGISVPDHMITLNGWFTSVREKPARDLVKVLEDHGIWCLLSASAAPTIMHAKHISKELISQIKNPIEVKL